MSLAPNTKKSTILGPELKRKFGTRIHQVTDNGYVDYRIVKEAGDVTSHAYHSKYIGKKK